MYFDKFLKTKIIALESYKLFSHYLPKVRLNLWHNFYHSILLFQCCPTLSPFATCGDKIFECGDRQLFRTGFVLVNTLCITQIMIKVATAKPLSPQLWRMWRQRECGWTPLSYSIVLCSYFYEWTWKKYLLC